MDKPVIIPDAHVDKYLERYELYKKMIRKMCTAEYSTGIDSINQSSKDTELSNIDVLRIIRAIHGAKQAICDDEHEKVDCALIIEACNAIDAEEEITRNKV